MKRSSSFAGFRKMNLFIIISLVSCIIIICLHVLRPEFDQSMIKISSLVKSGILSIGNLFCVNENIIFGNAAADPTQNGKGLNVTTTMGGPLNGRLGNQIFRNLAVSFIAEKFDLCCEYSSKNVINRLGIKLFSGNNIWNNTIELTDNNYFDILQLTSMISNLNPNKNFFQTNAISNLIHSHLHSNTIKMNIIEENPFRDRYNSNNDVCVHVRLGDVRKFNPGLKYYLKAISSVAFDHLYIFTNEKRHLIIQQIIQNYPESKIKEYDEIKTIQFASTCKNVILSHGTFSAVMEIWGLGGGKGGLKRERETWGLKG
jgi:hypothetical protein